MKRVLSPLRYPGSKVRIAGMVANILEKNLLVGSHVYEPFAGGSGVSLNLLANNFAKSATWVERDPMIYAFWVLVKERPQQLIDRMRRGQITLAAWKRLLPMREVDKPTKSNMAGLGYAGFFFNRTCFSGIVGAGPIGGMSQRSEYTIDCRFNKVQLASLIEQVSVILKNVEIKFGDGIEFLQDECLKMPEHSIVYIDPPYVTNGHKLYRYHFDKSAHERLAEAIAVLRTPWLLSYDNHELIRELYSGETTRFVKTYQSLKGSRFVKEILLLSDGLGVPTGENGREARRYGGAELSDAD